MAKRNFRRLCVYLNHRCSAEFTWLCHPHPSDFFTTWMVTIVWHSPA
ncbi:MAG: hypothetical protein ACKVJ7_02330 [Candidatus Poseidoniales archaeon]